MGGSKEEIKEERKRVKCKSESGGGGEQSKGKWVQKEEGKRMKKGEKEKMKE